MHVDGYGGFKNLLKRLFLFYFLILSLKFYSIFLLINYDNKD